MNWKTNPRTGMSNRNVHQTLLSPVGAWQRVSELTRRDPLGADPEERAG